MNLEEIGTWAAIIAGAIAIAVAIFGIVKFSYHKIKFMRPVRVRYLIPRAQYPHRLFEGAPAQELKPTKLVIGVGKYRIMNELTISINVNVDPFVLSFEGPNNNMPTLEEPDNPFIIENIESSGIKYRKDWWGNLHPYSPVISTSYWYKTEPRLTGHRITTYGDWKGKACFTIPIHGERPYVVKLDLEVSEENDQVPFLKVE